MPTVGSNGRGFWSPAILIIGGGTTPIQRDVLFGAHACLRRLGLQAISQQFVPPEISSAAAHVYVRGWRADAALDGQAKRNIERWIRDWQPRAVLLLFAKPDLVTHCANLAPTAAGMTYTDGNAIPSIDVDENIVVTAAAEHLLSLKLQHFAIIGSWALPWAVRRAEIFEASIRAAGFDCHRSEKLLPSEMLATSVSRESMDRWLGALPKPIGILACSDHVGMHLVHHCLAAGVRVPEDAAILSIGNDDVTCRMVDSPLSSVAINWQQIGYDAAALAGQLAAGQSVPPVRTLVGPAGVVVRQSTDLMAVEDPEVAAALRIIRDHSDRPLSVAELLRELPVDRNRLERQFRERVGRRILQEIRRVHIEQAKRLLATTDVPMPKIAANSGFPSSAKLSTGFRSETGLTPTEYRAKFRLKL